MASRRDWHANALINALERRSVRASCFLIKNFVAMISERKGRALCEGHVLEDYDAILVRTIPLGSLEQIIFRMDVLHGLEDSGVKIINSPATIEKTVDKYYTSLILERRGIATPKTTVTESMDKAMEAFNAYGDIVVKPLFGCGGKGMVRISDENLAYRTFRALEMGRYVYYTQEYIEHGDRDIRVFVVGDRAIASMIREGKTWKTNIAQGGKPRSLELTEDLKDLSVSAAKALGADYSGVDIIKSDKYYVVEVNSMPAWAGLQKVSKRNISIELADYVIGKLNYRNSAVLTHM